jgi:hypothetical protein
MSRTNELKRPVVWPEADWELINWIANRGTSPLEDLKPRYFRRPGDKEPTATWIIDQLFSNNLGMNFSEDHMEWMGARESFRGIEAGMQLMSPNPYVNQERRYIVVRFSEVISQRQKVTLLHQEEDNLYNIQSYLFVTLATKHEPRLPLVLVTECAEVLEGRFRCESVPEDTLQDFFQGAMKMGAEAVLWDKHQKVLVPGGTGVNGMNATIEFFSEGIGK